MSDLVGQAVVRRCQAGHLAQKTLITDPVMTFMGPNGTRLFTEMGRMIKICTAQFSSLLVPVSHQIVNHYL